MKTLAAIVFCALLVACKADESYFVLIGDRAVPAYESVKVGDEVGGRTPLMVFSRHSGSHLAVHWDGRLESSFDGSGAIVLSRKKGALKIVGTPKKDMYLFILRGPSDGSSARVLDKSTLRANEAFEFSKDLK